MGAKIDQKSVEKWNPRWNAFGHQFLNDLLDLECQVGKQNRSKIDQKSKQKNDAKNKAVWDASWAVFGLSRGPRRTPTQRGATRRVPARPDGTKILSRGAARAAALRAKIPVKKETVLDVLTRLRPDAQRICFPSEIISFS